MAESKNPFEGFDDLFKQMKVPGLDLESMTAAYRKNLEAVNAATQVANENMQALARRQAEIVREAVEQMRDAASELTSAKDAQELVNRQAEIARQAFEKASANMQELAEMMTKSNTATMEIFQARMNEGLAEIQDLMQKTMKV